MAKQLSEKLLTNWRERAQRDLTLIDYPPMAIEIARKIGIFEDFIRYDLPTPARREHLKALFPKIDGRAFHKRIFK